MLTLKFRNFLKLLKSLNAFLKFFFKIVFLEHTSFSEHQNMLSQTRKLVTDEGQMPVTGGHLVWNIFFPFCNHKNNVELVQRNGRCTFPASLL